MKQVEGIHPAVAAVIERFNFQKVYDAMQKVNWQWRDKQGNLYSPSIAQLKDTAEDLLEKTRVSRRSTTCTASGGFEASKEKGILCLAFVLEDAFAELKYYNEQQ